MRALIDTCIIIDYLQERQPFFDLSRRVLEAAALGVCDGYITANSLTDIHYLMHHHTHDEQKCRQLLESLYEVTDVLDTSAGDCRRAISSPVSDYEDAIMAETARSNGLDCIVTRNLKDFAKSPVPAYSPEEFLAKL